MSDTHVADDAFINSIIGEGTKFKGEFDLNGLLRIDGDFTGVIRTKGKVLVGKNGRAECTLNAGTVVIGDHVRVSPAAVSHGSLTVTIKEEQRVSQPNALSQGGTTVTVPDSTPDCDTIRSTSEVMSTISHSPFVLMFIFSVTTIPLPATLLHPSLPDLIGRFT